MVNCYEVHVLKEVCVVGMNKMVFDIVNIIRITVTTYISGEALLVFIVFMIYLLFVRRNTKVNVIDIIKRHVQTLKDYASQKSSKKDYFTFFVLPAFVAITLAIKGTITDNGTGILLTVFSIFAGLLFNLLILIMDIGRRVKKQGEEKSVDAKKQRITETLISETYSNVAFSILISLTVICITLIFIVGLSNMIFKFLVSLIIYWLVIVFIMTLFMILKRVFRLLDNEIK